MSRKTRLYLLLAELLTIFVLIPVLTLPQATLDAWRLPVLFIIAIPLAWLLHHIEREHEREDRTPYA